MMSFVLHYLIGLGMLVDHFLFGQEIASTQYPLLCSDILMYGNLCALAAATIWVTMGIYLELAVSSTHSIGEWVHSLIPQWFYSKRYISDFPSSIGIEIP